VALRAQASRSRALAQSSASLFPVLGTYTHDARARLDNWDLVHWGWRLGGGARVGGGGRGEEGGAAGGRESGGKKGDWEGGNGVEE